MLRPLETIVPRNRRSSARATFERLGFKPEAPLTDWVMANDGRTRDLLVTAYDLEG